VLYILDEPSIGLHQRDNARLLETLIKLRDLGNTVLVVEHDADTIRAADYVIDMGPRAGELGGRVVAVGTPKEIEANPASVTGAYLSGEKAIDVPKHRRGTQKRALVIRGARTRSLRNLTHSFNVKGGRCEACQGDGIVRMEMHFLPDVYVECEACGGRRYSRETLEVKYRQASIADVLDMTVSQACAFLENIPKLRPKLETLREVGLGYVALGQAATTLSGGEAQRVKLSRELAKKATGRTLYMLDEPTTGLHFADIDQLLRVLARLVDAGNTVIVIEHNLDVVKNADWVIDLGPGGGPGGGQVIAEGSPEDVAKVQASFTGQFLRKVL